MENNPFEVIEGQGGIGSGKPLNLTLEEKKERRKQQLRNAQRRYREANREKYNKYMGLLYRGEKGNVDIENWKQRNKEAMNRFLAKKRIENLENKKNNLERKQILANEKKKLLQDKKNKIKEENKNKPKNERILLKDVKLSDDDINQIKNKLINTINNQINEENKIIKYTPTFETRFTDDFLNEDLRNETFKPNYEYSSDKKTGFEPSDYEEFFKQMKEVKDIGYKKIGSIRNKYVDEREEDEINVINKRNKLLKKTKKSYQEAFKPKEEKVVKEVKEVKIKEQKGLDKYVGKTYKGITFTQEDVDKVKEKYKGKEIPPAVLNNIVGFELDVKSLNRKQK